MPMETKMNGRAFIEHWSWAAAKGLMNPTTARILKNACLQVLNVQDGWENLDLDDLEAEDAFIRFQNLRGKALTPRSLRDYRHRFEQALESYRSYVSDPSAWKGPGQDRVRRGTTDSAKSRSKDSQAAPTLQDSATVANDGSDSFSYPFPIRSGFVARVTLPADLRSNEAKRLCTFIMSLAVDSDALLLPRE
jgi:hypothetical protein